MGSEYLESKIWLKTRVKIPTPKQVLFSTSAVIPTTTQNISFASLNKSRSTSPAWDIFIQWYLPTHLRMIQLLLIIEYLQTEINAMLNQFHSLHHHIMHRPNAATPETLRLWYTHSTPRQSIEYDDAIRDILRAHCDTHDTWARYQLFPYTSNVTSQKNNNTIQLIAY